MARISVYVLSPPRVWRMGSQSDDQIVGYQHHTCVGRAQARDAIRQRRNTVQSPVTKNVNASPCLDLFWSNVIHNRVLNYVRDRSEAERS